MLVVRKPRLKSHEVEQLNLSFFFLLCKIRILIAAVKNKREHIHFNTCQKLCLEHKKLYSVSYDNLSRKGMWKKIYTCVNHLAVHLKLIQHCKLTILQLKKKNRNDYINKTRFFFRSKTFTSLQYWKKTF